MVVSNLFKAWKKWYWLKIILTQAGENMRLYGTFFKALVQVVLLFGSETWVMTPHMGKAL